MAYDEELAGRIRAAVVSAAGEDGYREVAEAPEAVRAWAAYAPQARTRRRMVQTFLPCWRL